MIPLSFLRDVGLRPLLDSALRNGYAERTVHQQDAVDGLPRRHRGRTACLRKSGLDSQTYTTYRWTTPLRTTPHVTTAKEYTDSTTLQLGSLTSHD